MADPLVKITWRNGQAPALNDTNLNAMQTNIETYVENNIEEMTDYVDENMEEMQRKVDSVVSGMPIGSGCDYFGTTAPEDFMFADGRAISRTTYAELFAIIGTTYGQGDGSTTFNLPDKRERVSVMYKTNSTMGTSGATFGTIGAKGGEDKHTLTTTEMPSHNHSVERGDATGTAVWAPIAPNGGNTNKKVNLNTTSAGGGKSHNNLQPYLVCNYIIKVK